MSLFCVCYFLSLAASRLYYFHSRSRSLSSSFLFLVSILATHSLYIRIILPKNSKSKCSIFRPYFYLFLVCKSFFSSVFYTFYIPFVILLRHFRTFYQLVWLSLHHCALTTSSFHLFSLDEYECVGVYACPFSQCQHHISHNMFNVVVFASLLFSPTRLFAFSC